MAQGNFNCGMLQKGVLTTVVNSFTSFKNCTKKRKQQAYVTSRLNMLEENMRIARQYHESIVGGGRLEADLKLEELVVVYEQIQEIYLEYRSDLLEALEKFSQATASVASGETAASSSKIRLREIDIPKFSGSYTTWRSFQGLFESMVHSNASLSDIDKMHYLKSCLVGEAERLLQHLPCDAGNYAKAWELLTSRYDHKRVLVNAQLKLLFGQSSLSKESANGLKELLDTSQECVHALANLGLRVEHWDAILIYVLLHKLPNSTQQLWEEKLGNLKELPTYKQFTEFLETRFRTLEVVDQQDLKGSSRPWVREDSAVSTRNRSYIDAQRVFLANTSSRDAFSCKLCHQGQHALRKCQRFLNFNPMQRKQAVRNAKVCDNCLGYGHMVRECPSTKCCYFCQQRHHSLLHVHEMQTDNSYQTSNYNNNNPNNNYYHHNNNNSDYSNNNEDNNIQATTTQRSQQPRSGNTQSYQVAVNPNAPAFQPSEEPQPSTSRHINTFYSLSQGSKALLATAMVRVRSADGRFHDLRALIDPGSEATFISESAAQLLRLKRHRAFVEVSGLGMVSSGTTQNYVDVMFASRHSTFESAVRAFVFKSLTGLLPTQQMIPDKWQHLSGLRLADPDFYVPAPVDLLFGIDVFDEILLPDIIRCEDKVAPIAQKTKLGWIIFGKVPAETPQQLHSFVQFTNMRSQLQTFRELEEEPFQTKDHEEDIVYDEHLDKNNSGCYQAMLTFKEEGHPAMGSSKESALRRFANFEKRNAHHNWKEVAGTLANLGTEWHCISPTSPHFGELWEAGVKSVQYHLKTVVGSERLAYDEFGTFHTQSEACLNSRPLCPLSDNVNDLGVITPAHLLVGEPLHTVSRGENTLRKIGCSDRWKRLQSNLYMFCHKWNTRLQHHPKWIKTEAEPKTGDFVLLKDERLPPSHWSSARIHETHPGSERFTRILNVKTISSLLRRLISKICYLPTIFI